MLRVTQNAIEVVRKPTTADLRVTAYAAEVLRRPAAPRICASQLAVEILRTNAPLPDQFSLIRETILDIVHSTFPSDLASQISGLKKVVMNGTLIRPAIKAAAVK